MHWEPVGSLSTEGGQADMIEANIRLYKFYERQYKYLHTTFIHKSISSDGLGTQLDIGETANFLSC